MLITCPECDNSVSDKALACPHCGYPMQQTPTNNVTRTRSKRSRRALKAPNGSGSVYNTGRPNKPYRAVVTLEYVLDPVTHKAKQKRKTIGYFKTQDEAVSALVQYKKNPLALPPTTSLQEVYERWSDIHFNKIKEGGIKKYKAAYNLLKPIKNKPFAEITLDEWQNIADNSGKNYPTLKDYKVLVGLLYKFAIMHDIVDERSNKAKYIDLSLFENPNQRVRQPFTTDEITLLWQNQPNIQYIDVILLLMYTGVRISELLNLKKADVNLSERFFNVTASKTDAGIRTVPIADKILPFFKKWYDLNNSDYLISMNDSKPFKYRNFYDAYWSAIMQQLSMKHTPHDTRHTFISLMTQKEVDERLIQQIVGHKGTSVTTNVYTHIDVKTMLDAVNLI